MKALHRAVSPASFRLILSSRWLVAVLSSAMFTTAWAIPPGGGGDQPMQTLPDPDLDLKSANALAPSGSDALGDSVDFYTFALSFRQTDIAIPGNSALSVAITRRFSPSSYNSNPTKQSPNKAFGSWEIAVPRITTELSNMAPWPANRCTSAFEPPPVKVSNVIGSIVDSDFYWSGYVAELPGFGSVNMVESLSGMPHPSTFTRLAKGGIGFACGTAHDAAGNSVGEGFIAHTPDGMRYVFDLLTQGPAPRLKFNNFLVNRYTAIMLATAAYDRFGNWVQYHYDSQARLIGITGSDGRAISITWTTLSTGQSVIGTIVAGSVAPNTWITPVNGQIVISGSRTWAYQYSTANGVAELTGVTRPDGRQWQFSLWSLYSYRPENQPGAVSGTVTSPDGLSGTFEAGWTYKVHSGYPWPQPPGSSAPPPGYYTTSLYRKTLSGPNLSPLVWNYSFVSGLEPWVTQMTLPSQNRVRYSFGGHFDWSESNLLKTEYLDSAGTVVRTVDQTFEPGAMIGNNYQSFRNGQQDSVAARLTSRIVRENGDSYWVYYSGFDGYEQPTQIQRGNSFSSAATTETLVINNSMTPWLIGQTVSSTVNGLVPSNRTLSPAPALQPTEEFSFGRRTTRATYYADGQTYQVRDELNPPETYSDYFRGQARRVDHADSTVRTRTVNEFGELLGVTDERGNSIAVGRDVMGRVTSVTYPSGDTQAWAPRSITYTTISEFGLAAGTLRQRITEGRLQQSTYFDALMRPILTESLDTVTGSAVYARKTYGPSGSVSFESYPSVNPYETTGINYFYDALDRVVLRKTTDNVTLEQISYLSGNRKRVTDADNRTTTVTYQALDSPTYEAPIRIEAPESRTTTYVRDVFGKPLSGTQAGSWSGGSVSATRTWEYNSNQLLCRMVEPETNGTVFGYDIAGQLIWQGKGQSGSGCLSTAPWDATVFTYNSKGQKILDDNPATDDDVSYAYDAVGNLTTVYNSTALWRYDYNKRNLLEKETATIDGKTFVLDPAYDTQGYVASKTLPDGTVVSYSPDAWGRATQLNGYVTGAEYYPSGSPKKYLLGNGLAYSQQLDTRLRPDQQDLRSGVGGPCVQCFRYLYTPGSDIISVQELAQSADNASFAYDGLHRVTTATGLWGTYTYTYDPLNNIRSRGGPNALSYSYDGGNRLTSVTGALSRSYAYNNQGEVLSDGARSFTLNSAGQVKQLGSIATYLFDGNGKRIKTIKGGTVEYAIYDRAGSLVHTESGSTKTSFLQLGQTQVELKNEGGTLTPKYLQNDWLGSPRKATSAAAATLWNETYEPFGKKMNGVSEKTGYTGHSDDPESGLTYAKARYYDSAVGRFLSPDPVRLADDFNLYAYVGNNPINATDPTGLETKPEKNGASNSKECDFSTNCQSMISPRSSKAKPPTAAEVYAACSMSGECSYTAIQMEMGEISAQEALERLALEGIGGAIAGAAVGGILIGGELALAARGTATAANSAAKATMFANRTASELKSIYGWGKGLEGVQAARNALNANAMARIQGSVSRAEVEAARDLYRTAVANGRGGQVAVERMGYMDDILSLWK